MSTLQATNLKHGSSASNNLVLDANGNVTAAGTVAMASPFAMRNKIINGAMEIDQRNAGAAVANSGGYSVDRWADNYAGSGRYSAQRSTVAPTGFINSLLHTVTTAVTAAATDVYQIFQPIEGTNAADLGFGTSWARSITVSFWVRSSIAGTYGFFLYNTDGTRSITQTYTVNAANTWEYKTITLPGDTTGTYLTNNGQAFVVGFDLGSGSNQNTATLGAWQSSVYRRTASCVNFMATNGATFYLTGVQLEVGSVATPFERRLFPQELAMCQRYYEKSYEPGFMPGANPTYAGASLGVRANGGWTVQGVYKVTKRAIPTVTTYSPANGTAGTIRNENLGGDETATVNTSGVTQFSVGGTGSTAGVLYSAQWAVSAEL